jgi:tripartite-type tricarboxylate transporter receptor subunit TctC
MLAQMVREKLGLQSCMAALLTLFCLPDAALAEYPERPVSLIVNSAPGGIGDAVSRIIAEKLSQKWGQGIVVMNKSGAGGLISTNETLHQPADGYYVYVTDASISTNGVCSDHPDRHF